MFALEKWNDSSHCDHANKMVARDESGIHRQCDGNDHHLTGASGQEGQQQQREAVVSDPVKHDRKARPLAATKAVKHKPLITK
jgi:hypothetical protein